MSSRVLLRVEGVLVAAEDDGRRSSSALCRVRMTGAHLRGTTSLAARERATPLAPGRDVTPTSGSSEERPRG
ncbi:MAG: hypothetical protein ACRCYR_13805 [Phycicoccus sp.]